MLTFAGEPLLFPDAKVDAFLARNLELLDLSQFAAVPPHVASSRHAVRSRFEQNKGLGLPIVNWPYPPPPRINTLWWPTGATRWAMGWFLATRKSKDNILAAVKPQSSTSGVQKATLGMGDDLDNSTDTTVNAIDMYLLPPRPISWTGTNGDDGDLWLIPLVDERYFWQFVNVGDISVTTSTTWASLFSTLGSALGVTVTVSDAVESAYLNPDPTDFTRKYDNAALLLDAAAWSVGRRVVRTIDGTVTVQARATADTALSDNLDQEWRQLAGGDFSDVGGDQPAKLTMTFCKMKEYFLQADNALYTVDKDAPSGTNFIEGKSLTVHCAAYADYDVSNSLQNGTALDALAEQLKTDYYGWAAKDYDRVFSGVTDWKPTGYDDAILWAFGRTCPDKCFDLIKNEDGSVSRLEDRTEQLAYTRVQTLPGNCWPEVNLCSDPSKEVATTTEIVVKNTGSSIAALTGTGSVQVWTGTPGSEANSGKTVTVYNKTSTALGTNKFGSAGYVQGQIYVTPWQT
jgi:hypothetical protein